MKQKHHLTLAWSAYQAQAQLRGIWEPIKRICMMYIYIYIYIYRDI